MSFVQLFTGSLIQLFLYTVKKTSCHCMQSCLSPHPSIEIFIYQRIYLKYSYLETFPGGAPLRVTYAEPKPPSCPQLAPLLPPLTFPIVAPATLSITNLPCSTNCCPTKNLMECSLLGESPMPSIPETCNRPINEFLARAAPEDGLSLGGTQAALKLSP